MYITETFTHSSTPSTLVLEYPDGPLGNNGSAFTLLSWHWIAQENTCIGNISNPCIL